MILLLEVLFALLVLHKVLLVLHVLILQVLILQVLALLLGLLARLIAASKTGLLTRLSLLLLLTKVLV